MAARTGLPWTCAGVFTAWAALACPAFADAQLGDSQCLPAPAPRTAEQAAHEAIEQDETRRVIAPVRVNGRGPFRFMIDTGANHSALSEDLAGLLALPHGPDAPVHTVEGVRTTPTSEVASLEMGAVSVRGGTLPVFDSDAFAGEDGVLGVDGMGRRRLTVDFEHDCVELRPSEGAPALTHWTETQGALRFGHLLTTQARVGPAIVNLLIDTGSEGSLANPALVAALEAQAQMRPPPPGVEQILTAGAPAHVDGMLLLPRVELDGVRFNNVTALIGAFHVFDLWGFADEPALLVGMDVLSQSGAMAIDYDRARLYFRPRGRG